MAYRSAPSQSQQQQYAGPQSYNGGVAGIPPHQQRSRPGTMEDANGATPAARRPPRGDARQAPAPHGSPTPARPARSQRRPMGHSATPSNASAVDYEMATGAERVTGPAQRLAPSQSSRADNSGASRAARLHQAIQQDSGRNGFSDDDMDSSMMDDDMGAGASSTGPLAPRSQALSKAVAAFSSAGSAAKMRKNTSQDSQPVSQEPVSSATTGRGRRGAVGVQGESARMRGQPRRSAVPTTPAFREMERVLTQAIEQWPELMPPSVLEDRQEQGEEGDSFDPVSLALSLVAPDASPDRFRAFMSTKDALSRSLKGSINTHYRAFDGSISSYNGLLSNLAAAQSNTSSLRSSLEEVRETLGKARKELGVLEARRTELAEMDRILVSIETLKNVPDVLESLMTEKRFLQAVSLLVRSLKMVNKPDLVEIAATADLRSYFVGQEALTLEYLTEELHSHLYLKSIYTDSRYKAYAPGQTELPTFLVENTETSIFDDNDDVDVALAGDRRSKHRQTRLAHYLAQLAQRPDAHSTAMQALDEGVPLEMLLAGYDSDRIAEDVASEDVGAGAKGVSGIQKSTSFARGLAHAVHTKHNPEQDSFAYIENLITCLTMLGKLSVAVDSVLQRAPIEVYNLVESTAAEVDERNESTRRNVAALAGYSTGAPGTRSTLNGTMSNGSANTALAYSLLVQSSMTGSNLTSGGASGYSASLREVNTDVMLDFLWTLFSKLDGVLQGFRVMYEVLQRMAEQKDLKDAALVNKQGNLIYNMTDIWRPIQSEIQALLHDYFVDERAGATSHRTHVISLNDTLRLGRPARDPKKALFKFAETDAKLSNRRLRSYEDALDRSLKQSVPGLVSSLVDGAPTVFNATSHASSEMSATGDGGFARRTHRMLAQPASFRPEALVTPTMKFVERAQTVLPEGTINVADTSDTQSRRYSGLMDEQTTEKLGPALDEWHKQQQMSERHV